MDRLIASVWKKWYYSRLMGVLETGRRSAIHPVLLVSFPSLTQANALSLRNNAT